MSYIQPKMVQRLTKPTGFGNPISDMTLGFYPEVLQAFNKVVTFDYMGSSEFEFGALPRAFERLRNRIANEEYVAREIEIDVLSDPMDKGRFDVPLEKKQIFQVLAPAEVFRSVAAFIESEAMGEPSNDLLERTQLQSACFEADKPADDYRSSPIVGWFDMDNSAMFFIDREMAEVFRGGFESKQASFQGGFTIPRIVG